MAPIVNGTATKGPMVNGTSTSSPIVNGTASSEPIKIKNGLDDSMFNQDIVKLENLPDDIKELCQESLKVRCVLLYLDKLHNIMIKLLIFIVT